MMKFLLIPVFLVGCVQSFDPSIEQSEDQPIIIDALLTDELKNHKVTISSAKYIDGLGLFSTIENAEVYIEDSQGGIYTFNHFQNGIYTSEDTFAGEKALSYRIVVTIDSEQYVSDFESISETGKIIDVKSKFGYEATEKQPGVFSDEPRIEFLVDIELNDTEADSYFRFDWEATYETETPDQGDPICWEERGQVAPSDLKSEEICYVTERPSSFIRAFSTEGASFDKTINGVSVYSIHPNKRFQFRYSPEITMYSISKSAFDFWELIVNQNENTGGLFDPALSPIRGNIQSVNESGKGVIGIFEVASAAKKRSFFLRSDVPIEIRIYERECDLPNTDTAGNPRVYPRPFFCCDCILLPNCSNVKPDFW